MRVDVLWTGRDLTTAAPEDGTVVVIDVLRASTTILTALSAGARRAIPCATIEEAARAASSIGRPETLLCGERGGRKVEGFDFGNSPLEYTSAAVADKNLVFSTTNGTPAMSAASRTHRVLLACFRNLDSATDRILSMDRPVMIVCAGRSGRVSLDDVLCAGLIVRRLTDGWSTPDLSDGAAAALSIARSRGLPDSSWLGGTEAGSALIEIGYERDLDFCAATNVAREVPVWRDGGFELMPEVVQAC